MNSVTPQTNTLSKVRLNTIRTEMNTAHHDFSSALLKTALYKTNDGEVSNDLVQNTFLKTLIYLRKGGKIDLMRGFLNHVLNNLIIDEYRYRSRKNKVVSLDALLENGFDLGYDDFQKKINVLDGQAIVALIHLLPKKYELVIRMRYMRGLTLKEMAEENNLTENTVAVQVHRGLEKLHKLYEDRTTAKN